MKDLWAFAGNHQFVAVLLAIIAAWLASQPFKFIYRSYKLRVRSRNIREKGWPPHHLYADGDSVL